MFLKTDSESFILDTEEMEATSEVDRILDEMDAEREFDTGWDYRLDAKDREAEWDGWS